MSEYLEREALVAATENVPFKTSHGLTKEQCEGANFARLKLAKIFKMLPTADVVPVVRCKDCKWWVREGNDSFGYAMFCDHDCSLGGQGIKKPDDYCSYGERKGGDE